MEGSPFLWVWREATTGKRPGDVLGCGFGRREKGFCTRTEDRKPDQGKAPGLNPVLPPSFSLTPSKATNLPPKAHFGTAVTLKCTTVKNNTVHKHQPGRRDLVRSSAIAVGMGGVGINSSSSSSQARQGDGAGWGGVVSRDFGVGSCQASAADKLPFPNQGAESMPFPKARHFPNFTVNI